MKRDISEKKFESLSKEKKKQYIAELLIRDSNAPSVSVEGTPWAIVMAGLPGSGKTEFLDTIAELLVLSRFDPWVRIDQIKFNKDAQRASLF